MHGGEKHTVHTGDIPKVSMCRIKALERNGRTDPKEQILGPDGPEVFNPRQGSL